MDNYRERKTLQVCPDCDGEARWPTVSGNPYESDCPTCAGTGFFDPYGGNRRTAATMLALVGNRRQRLASGEHDPEHRAWLIRALRLLTAYAARHLQEARAYQPLPG